MTREEIRNKIFAHLRQQIGWIKANPNQIQQFQLGQIYHLFQPSELPAWEQTKVQSIAREIFQELENCGYVYEGQAGGMGDASQYPWFTITEYGKEALLSEDWLPYDPEGYVKALKNKVPTMDEITLSYIGEAVAAYNRRHLLSATITLGVASENLMLLLIETYTGWLAASRKASFQKKIAGRFISSQYKEFKREFTNDVKSFSKDIQVNWETYLDGVFNFIRFNRNDAGHPTGKLFDAKVIYANLQIFADYAQFVLNLNQLFKK